MNNWRVVSRWRALGPLLVAGVAAIIALLAVEAIRAIAHDLSAAELKSAVTMIAPWRIGAALLLSALSYLALSCYDGLALQLMGKRLPWRLTGYTAFTSYAVSNSLGFALITGGSARYGLYGRAGLDRADIVRLTLLCSGAFWSGLLLSAGIILFFAAPHQNLPLRPPFDVSFALVGGLLLLIVIAAYTWLLGGRNWRGRSLFGMPDRNLRTLALLQFVALLDIVCAASALFVLLDVAAARWPQLALAYSTALVAGVASHVPGGLGVFDATFLALAPVGAGAGLAAILIYRLLYYFLPLALALLLQAVRIGPRLLGPARQAAALVGRVQRVITPAAAAILSMVSGAMLLISVATPDAPDRLHFLGQLDPGPLVDTSHFLASLAGTALLLLGPALNARVRSAFLVTIATLVAGALLSLAKGLDYEVAIVLLLVAAIIQTSSGGFYRTSGLGSTTIGALAWAIILAVLAAALMALLLSHDRLVAGQSWWAAEFGAEASRSVRALLAAALLLSLIAFRQLLFARSPSGAEPLPAPEVLEPGLAAAERSDAMLAFTGDKQFLVSDHGDAFLMYRVHGRTWIVMGDPVGPHGRWAELAWRLREAADREAGLVCFYEVSERMLPVLVDLGLATMKYGEEAVIDLAPGFVLAKGVRSAMRRLERDGVEFAIIPAADVPAMIPALKLVSDEWLRGKPGDEKCFSLGRFDPFYLARFDCAVARQGEQVLAFANIWAMPNRHEVSIDLMRRRSEAPNGTMDFLLGHCIDHAAKGGVQRFSLGMAPLAGLTSRRLAPYWAHFGATIFRRGNRIYGFTGLRAFKQKFHPRWESRYVATLHGWKGWRALIDTARLIGA